MSSLSSWKSLEVQPWLFPQVLGNHGHVRTVIGNLAEELTAEFVRGRRHRTDSTADYCPDVSVDSPMFREFYECKAVGRSKTAFVYGGRLEKDRAFAKDHLLHYVIWHHVAEPKLAKTVEELERLVLVKMRALYVVPFAEIDAVCRTLPVEKLNSKYDGSSLERPETYGTGHRIRLSLLERFRFRDYPFGIVARPPR